MKEGKTLITLRLVAKILFIVSMILGIFAIFPFIFSLLGLKYLKGIEAGTQKRNLVRSILGLLGNGFSGLVLILDYIANKDAEVKPAEEKQAEANEEVKEEAETVEVNEKGETVKAQRKADKKVTVKTGDSYWDEKAAQETIAASLIMDKQEAANPDVPAAAPKKPKSKVGGTIRTIIYGVIIGGLALGSVTLFSIAQFQKAKYKASKEVIESASAFIEDVIRKDSALITVDEESNSEYAIYTVNDSQSESKYYGYAKYLVDVYDHFRGVKIANNVLYVLAALPAYGLSMMALISVGLILNHSEKVKEKEEKEV